MEQNFHCKAVQKPFSPPLAGGDEGEGEQSLAAAISFFTPTPALPRQGGRSYVLLGQLP